MKYHLYDKHRQLLKDWRNDKGKGYSAEEVSEMLGHHKSWLGQIERGRLISIKQEDLTNLLSILLDIPKEEITEDNIENFIFAYDPFYKEEKEQLTDKIFNKIIDVFPFTSSELSAINYELSDMFAALKQVAKDIDKNQRENLWMMLSYFNKNLNKDPIKTMAFASLPYHLLFQKYKDDEEKLVEIYNHIIKYLEECIDEEVD